ncbi:glycosyltransferase [Gleimia sp. 6138-11-ORH1]|uniref:glycosyltransferase n=1 Tax=Gleimia sp. 6138-11-ORH1 TaxID=2973937 RepID=UPI00216A0224|nr:glycosyltransferase [Gleimia sp. 6138-11-ORH1]MCS4484034.1 glycosyltransferase [Gleimia sp. 6138-11-ORH1]
MGEKNGFFQVVSRIHLPEASAASFRLDAVEKALAAAGQEFRVLTAKLPQGMEVKDSAPIRRVPVIRDKDGYIKGYIPYMSFDIPAFFSVLMGKKPQVVLVEPPPTTGFMMRLACGIRKIPYVWYGADVWSDAAESTGAPKIVVDVVRFMEKTAVRGAAACIAVSEGVAERLNEFGAKTVEVIPNGADTEIFNLQVEPFSKAELAKLGVTEPYAIYAGTASQWQGAEIFAKAFSNYWKETQKNQLVFIGRGDSMPKIREIADDLAVYAKRNGCAYQPILVLDSFPPAEAAKWQRGAQVALVSIQPDIGYDFAYPTKVLTALGCGTAVLYAGVGPAIADIEKAQLGYTCKFATEPIVEVMRTAFSAPADAEASQRRADWVLSHRSMKETGRKVAALLMRVATSK